jgi:hypothetical protein
MKYASKHTLEPLESIPHEVSSHEYGSITIEIREHIQIEKHITQEVHEDQIDPTSKLLMVNTKFLILYSNLNLN